MFCLQPRKFVEVSLFKASKVTCIAYGAFAVVIMDLLSYCTLRETKQVDYSSENPLNRESTPRELIEQYVPEHLMLEPICQDRSNSRTKVPHPPRHQL